MDYTSLMDSHTVKDELPASSDEGVITRKRGAWNLEERVTDLTERYRAKLMGKGQVHVPKAVRQALRANRGDEMVFEVREDGAVYITCEEAVDLMALAGALRPPGGRLERDEEREAGRRHLGEGEPV